MKTINRILIVDDEPNIRRILQVAFEKAGYHARVAENAHQAIQVIAQEDLDCVLTDVTMPGRTGYDLLRDVTASKPELPVVMMTAFGTIPQAIQAIREGAREYVTKPFDLEQLKRIIANVIDDRSAPKKSNAKGAPVAGPSFVAESPAMQQVRDTIIQVADSKATVMIWGESGVGKEVVSRAIHTSSPRVKKPFVAVSCAALPESLLESELFGYEKGAFTGANGSKAGRFEMAHEGTLFLDEVGEIPASVQVKLLRVLQEREFERLGANKPTRVDVRLVTATNRDLREAVEQGLFRLDLLYRLQVVEIWIPPLRDRREDIRPLAELFLTKYGKENERTPLAIGMEAQTALERYAWPGNVRELENMMERATVLASKGQDELTVQLLPGNVSRAA